MGVAATMRSWWRQPAALAGVRGAVPGLNPVPGPAAPARAGSGWRAALSEYFRYHGVMAPGVRLLRVLPIGAKLAVVAAASVLPLTFVAMVLLWQIGERIDYTRGQALSLARLRLTTAAIGALRLERMQQTARLLQLPAAPDASRVNLDRPELKALLRLPGPDADPRGSEDKKRLLAALQRVAEAPHGSQARFDALLDAGDELLIYAHWISSGALDREPEYPTTEQAQFAASELPRLAVRLAAVADLAALAQASPADTVLRFQIRQRVAPLERALADVAFTHRRLQAAGSRAAVAGLGDVEARAEAVLGAAARLLAQGGAADPAAPSLVDGSRQAHELLQRKQEAAVAELEERLETRMAGLQRERAIVVALLLLLTAVPVYLLLALHRVMAGGMVKVVEEVQRLSSGDLSERPLAQGRDEVAGTLNSLSSSLSMLADMFSHVRQGAAAVAHASGEIARGNTELERRTVDSREGLERVVEAVRACVTLLDDCGRRVDATVAVVDAMRLDAARSRANMGALDKRMQDLRRKSGEIDAIVELIDGIAFRTNILALNASIESSKAGEAGRGFAVVAQEVRRLARRSADNARQISEIIGGAREDIERGAALADHTGADMKSTDALVGQVHEAMRDVVQLTRQGHQRSQQILDEVGSLTQLTDANGELVHQIAAASKALSAQGGQLSQRVENFKLS